MASALSLSVLRTARGLGLARPLWKARTGAHAHTRPPRPRPALQRFYCASTPPNPPSTPTTATKAALDSNIKALGGELRTAKGVELSAAEIARKEKVLADFEQDFLSFAARDKDVVDARSVIAFTVSDTFDLFALQLELQKFGSQIAPQIMQQKKKRRGTGFMSLQVRKDACLKKHSASAPYFLTWNGHDKDYFFFEDGAVVCWGASAHDITSLDTLLRYHAYGTVVSQREEMAFELADSPGLDVEKDLIRLSTNTEQSWHEKIAYSIGLARSVKLDEYELEVERAVNKAQALDFGRKPSTSMDGKVKGLEARAELASLYNLRYKMTVRSRLLEDPAFFWDKPSSLYNLYAKIDEYLDLDSRVENVQEKLELPMSYWKLENDHAGELTSWRLEMMIIIIIFMELILAILSKSTTWRDLTFEDLVHNLFVRLGVRKDLSQGTQYEIIEEVIEMVEGDNAQ